MSIKRTGSLEKSLNRFKSTDAQHVKVGVLDNSAYPDGTPVAAVAFWNEYGTKKIPPRPFFRSTIEAQRSAWVELTKKGIKAGYSLDHVLGLVGLQMMTDIQYTIMTFSNPPNSATTVALKGTNSPLRHTMLLHDSIKSEVVDGEM